MKADRDGGENKIAYVLYKEVTRTFDKIDWIYG